MMKTGSELGARGSDDRFAAVRRFTEAFFAQHGAQLVAGDLGLRASLGAALARHFGSDRIELVFRPSHSGNGELVSPGSRTFERIVAFLDGLDKLAIVPLRAVIDEAAPLPEDAGLVPQLGVVDASRSEQVYSVELAVRVAFTAEERHEQLLLVLLADDEEPRELASSEVARFAQEGWLAPAAAAETVPTERALRSALDRLDVWLAAWARAAAAPREAAMLERLAKEVQRLTGYYGELIAQNELDDNVREELAADLDRRVAEEVARHRLSVELVPVAYAVLVHPVLRTTATLRHGDVTARAEWLLDRTTGELRGPRCRACGERSRRVALCEHEGGHSACASCAEACSVCGHWSCHEHGLVHCHLGGEPLCASCAVRCKDCGKPCHPKRLRGGRCERC